CQPARGAARQVLHPDAADRLEREAARIGRCGVPAKETRGERAVVDAEATVRHPGDRALDMGLERDRLDVAGRNVDALYATALGDHDCAAVSGPRVPGQNTQALRAALVCDLDGVEQYALRAGLEVPQPEGRARPEATALEGNGRVGKLAGKREPATDGRDLGREGSAARATAYRGPRRAARRNRRHLAVLELQTPDLVVAGECVAARADVVVDVAAVARDGRPVRAVVVQDLDALAAVAVQHPESAAAAIRARPRRLALHDDVLTIGRPRRRHHACIVGAVHDARIAAVRVHHPEVVLPGAIRYERDHAPIRRDRGMVVERDAAVLGQ